MASCLQLVCAGVSLIAIATATTPVPFNCSAGFTDQHHWSQAKLRYCCEHEKVGCGLAESTTSRALDPELEGVDCGGEVIREVAVDSDAEQETVVASCRTACFQDQTCGAWSVKQRAGVEQTIHRCWLHRDCANRKTDHKAISGLTRPMSHEGAAQVSATTTRESTTRSSTERQTTARSTTRPTTTEPQTTTHSTTHPTTERQTRTHSTTHPTTKRQITTHSTTRPTTTERQTRPTTTERHTTTRSTTASTTKRDTTTLSTTRSTIPSTTERDTTTHATTPSTTEKQTTTRATTPSTTDTQTTSSTTRPTTEAQTTTHSTNPSTMERETTTRSTLVLMQRVDYPKKMTAHGLDGVMVDTNCLGQDLVEVAIAGANKAARAGKGNLVVAACRQACIDNRKKGCIAWTLNYGSFGMQGRGHCWLKSACTGKVKDTRAISGTIEEKAELKDAMLVDGGDALKSMEEGSQQTKKIVGGVVGAGVGALAVGLLGGILGKKAVDTQQQQIHEQKVGGVGGTRGMGGILGTISGSSADSASRSSAVGITGRSALALHELANSTANGTANSTANSNAALDNKSGDAALMVADTSLHQTGSETQEHMLMWWWWIPLLLLLIGLLLWLGVWCLRKKATSTREIKGGKRKGGKYSRKRCAALGDTRPSPASSACSEAPMLEDVPSPRDSRMQMGSSQVGVQEGASASMQVGSDLFDAIDAKHNGVIDKASFNQAMEVQSCSTTMLAGGSASILGGGSTSVPTQQQQRPRSVSPPRCRPGPPRGTWMVFEGASAAMSAGGSAAMSPAASVSMMQTGASVSLMPTVARTPHPVTPSPAAPVNVKPPASPSHVMPPAGQSALHYGKPQPMYTNRTTMSSPSQMRSLTPPPTFRRPQLRIPPLH